MAISNWPQLERPREKLLCHGAKALSDAELLAIFFRTGIKGKSAVDLAREALYNSGGLRQLMQISESDFCQTKGLSSTKYAQLQASVELGRRCLSQQMSSGDIFNNISEIKNFLRMSLYGRKQEVFACIFLDTQHRMIAFEELFYGTIDSAAVYPRIIASRSLHHNAAAVILTHNHPSGSAIPSYCDIEITYKIRAALELIDVTVLDHFVIGNNEASSLVELGKLQ